ncbi:MAG: PEP-CTERM sorting domain-containing protein [Fimbriimonadaceae bacterium]|nr:PEP-CTERM sorting domain-containing protein [Fimbriimonadaceae bacterium]
MKLCLRTLALASVALSVVASAQIPALSSRPGASYTLYLNFGGFNYSGTWGGGTPGNTPAYTGSTAQMTNVWARIAEKFVSYNINVTTVDPAPSGSTDSQRKSFYDSQARMMHTVIGGNGGWSGGGGVSFIDVAQNVGSNGSHTNWLFAAQGPNDMQFVADGATHELGHSLNLWHQGDWGVSGQGNSEYSSNFGANGVGTFAPIMGVTYNSPGSGPQRSLWRVGNAHVGNNISTQNDMGNLYALNGMSRPDDGVGHTTGTATSLPLTGTNVNNLLAKGFLSPASTSSPNPIGVNSYTKDYFSFALGTSSNISLNLNAGGQWITSGIAAEGLTFRGSFNILNSGGGLVASSTEASSTLVSSYTGNLNAGSYFIEVLNYGGMTSSIDGTAKYYTSGSYFLTGSGFNTVPEPVSIVALGLGLVALVRRRRIK